MSFKLPDLIVESVIRDGFENARRDDTIIDDVFGDLTMAFASAKYGQSEIDKIKKMVKNREVNIIHSFNVAAANIPCVSIQLADDRENEAMAHIGNYTNVMTDPFTTPEDLESLVVVEAFTPVSYDTNTGVVRVDDSVNLSQVYANLLLVDSLGVEFPILGGVVNDAGKKQFIIDAQADVSLLVGAEIKSSLDYKKYQVRGNIEQVQLILGIHSRDALITKYLYTLVKYFVVSRRDDLISRGLQLSTYNGSDFHRNMEYGGDVVYTRFFNISGIVQHGWRSDRVQLVDSVNVNLTVPKDRLDNEELGITDQTIQVTTQDT